MANTYGVVTVHCLLLLLIGTPCHMRRYWSDCLFVRQDCLSWFARSINKLIMLADTDGILDLVNECRDLEKAMMIRIPLYMRSCEKSNPNKAYLVQKGCVDVVTGAFQDFYCSTEEACEIQLNYCQRHLREERAVDSVNDFADMENMCPLYSDTLRCMFECNEECKYLTVFKTLVDSYNSSIQHCVRYFNKECRKQAEKCWEPAVAFASYEKEEELDEDMRYQQMCLANRVVYDCLESLNERCQKNPIIRDIMANATRDKMKCLASVNRCHQEANACYNAYLSLVSKQVPTDAVTTSPVGNYSAPAVVDQRLCPWYRGCLRCLSTKVSGNCIINHPAVSHMAMHLFQLLTFCTNSSELKDIVCEKAVPCVRDNVSIPTACSDISKLMQCVSSTTESRVCYIDQVSVTLLEIHSWTSSMCSAMARFPLSYQHCNVLPACLMTSEEIDVTRDDGSLDTDALASKIMKSTVYLCVYLKKTARCYVTHAKTCGYTAQFVDVMTAQVQFLQNKCPDTVSASQDDVSALGTNSICTNVTDEGADDKENDDRGNATEMVPTMHSFVVAVIVIMAVMT